MTLSPHDDPVESLGALLARVRTETGKTQLRLAELLCAASGSPTVTRHEISRWEREERIPNGYWLRWLAAVLDIPLGELERAAAVARGRRDAGTDGPPAARAAPPDSTRLVSLAARIETLRRADDLVGGVDLVGIVGGELRAALDALRAADAASRRELLPLVAELAQLAGWVGADAGRPDVSARAHRIGLRAATAAGDAPLAGYLMAARAHLDTAETPAAALGLARRAYARARPTGSAGTRSLLLQRVAFAAARIGDRQACERALGAAERLFQQRDPAHDPTWLYWFDEAEFAAMAGRCYTALGRPRTAVPLLRAGLYGGRIRLRAWALYAAWLAAAQLDAGEVERACAVAGQALLTAVRVGSVRARDQVQALRPRLHRLRQAPAVREYAELARSAHPYLPAPAPAVPSGAGAGPAPLAGCG